MTRTGRPLSDKTPSKAVLVRLYVKEERSLREIGERLGVPKDTLHRALIRDGIPTRTKAKRSKLLKVGRRSITSKVEKKGLRGAARDLGVDHSTLLHHLRTLEDK